jgi:hypothetical protein
MRRERRVYFYESQSARPFTENEKKFFLNVLNNPQAWNVGLWVETNDINNAFWIVSLERQEYIDRVTRSHSHVHGLSVTFMHLSPRVTYFSYENWSRVPEPVSGTYDVKEYRNYVILHECGHLLGLGHTRCLSGKAPIMIQQTKGLGACEHNIWPLQSEKNLVRRKIEKY